MRSGRQSRSGRTGRRQVAALALVAAGLGAPLAAAAAELRSLADCTAAIAADPQAAREAAARWAAFGGGAEAGVCEARVLEALGARQTAALLLTEIAQDRGNGLPAATRAALFAEAGRLWLAVRQPALARETLGRAAELAPPDAEALALLAEAHGRLGDWPRAVEALDRALALGPPRADILALRAAARRKGGDASRALADAEAALQLLPSYDEALFEKGAALATLGRMPEALEVWFRLVELHPDGEMAELARRNMRQLAGQ